MDYEEVSIVFTSRLDMEKTKEVQPKIADLIEHNFQEEDIRGFFKSETHLHTDRVSEIAKKIAIELNLSKNDIDLVEGIAPFHDFGKLAVNKAILNKPGKLTPHEFKEIKKHSENGYNILMQYSSNHFIYLAALVALEHHEKWNGEGYPGNKEGFKIHLFSRIIAAADVLESLSATRCYKQPWNKDRIWHFFKDQKGKQFDPKVADIVINNLNQF